MLYIGPQWGFDLISYAMVLAIILFFGIVAYFSHRLIKKLEIRSHLAALIYAIEALLCVGLCAIILFPVIRFYLGHI